MGGVELLDVEVDKGGRPLKFSCVDDIYSTAWKYFKKCEDKNLPITITGLCMALHTTRDVLMDYERGKHDDVDNFSNAIKEMKLVCENYAETIAITKGHAGAIFILKNYGWKDTQSIESIETKRLIIIRDGEHGNQTKALAGRIHIQPEALPCNAISVGDGQESVPHIAGHAIQRANP